MDKTKHTRTKFSLRRKALVDKAKKHSQRSRVWSLPPHGQEADDADDNARRRFPDCVQEIAIFRRLPADQNEVAQGAGEEEDALQGQRDQEEVKVSVIPEPHTVTHPRAMVVEPEKELTF